MARPGGTIENTATGERITWLETAAHTGGARLRFRFEVRPGGRLPVRHLHPRQHEEFLLETGAFTVEVAGAAVALVPGEPLTVGPGVRHTWWNPSADTPAVMTVTFTPALNTEVFLEQFFGLGRDGLTRADGTPGFLQLMTMVNRYELYVAGPPVPLQRVMAAVLGAVGRLLGRRARYARYSPDGPV